MISIMEFFIIIVLMVTFVFLVRTFIRYEPKLDLVQSRGKYILFLWYNKFTYMGEYEGRRYIKLFEL